MVRTVKVAVPASAVPAAATVAETLALATEFTAVSAVRAGLRTVAVVVATAMPVPVAATGTV